MNGAMLPLFIRGSTFLLSAIVDAAQAIAAVGTPAVLSGAR